jgi:hypothetical protein
VTAEECATVRYARRARAGAWDPCCSSGVVWVQPALRYHGLQPQLLLDGRSLGLWGAGVDGVC